MKKSTKISILLVIISVVAITLIAIINRYYYIYEYVDVYNKKGISHECRDDINGHFCRINGYFLEVDHYELRK